MIGTAEMLREIERRVLVFSEKTKDDMIKEKGISSSLDEDDMKYYLNEVLEEIKHRKADL
jgi:hypothetical protein